MASKTCPACNARYDSGNPVCPFCREQGKPPMEEDEIQRALRIAGEAVRNGEFDPVSGQLTEKGRKKHGHS